MRTGIPSDAWDTKDAKESRGNQCFLGTTYNRVFKGTIVAHISAYIMTHVEPFISQWATATVFGLNCGSRGSAGLTQVQCEGGRSRNFAGDGALSMNDYFYRTSYFKPFAVTVKWISPAGSSGPNANCKSSQTRLSLYVLRRYIFYVRNFTPICSTFRKIFLTSQRNHVAPDSKNLSDWVPFIQSWGVTNCNC